MRSLLLAAAIATAVACRTDTRDRHERTTALAACADAIERAAAAPPGEQVEVVARGCPGPCVGLADWVSSRASARLRPGVTRGGPGALAALIGGCHARCEAAVGGAAAGARWPALVEACGVEELGVPRDQAGLASEEWLVLSDVARWLERGVSAGVDDGQVPGRIEHVTGAAAFTLPLPAHPGLPATRFVASTRARQFVAIGGAEVRTGALPVVRIRAGRLEVVAVPGASPGQVADLDRLAAVYAEHATLLGADTPPAPLVVADAATPIARILELVTRVDAATAELAVAGDVTLAHPVILERRVSQFGAPEVHLQPAGVLIRGFGDDRVADWDHLDAELDHFTAVNAPVRSLELVAGPTATADDLARLLDACVVARVSTLIFAPAPAPTP